jgi:hypothetical protein
MENLFSIRFLNKKNLVIKKGKKISKKMYLDQVLIVSITLLKNIKEVNLPRRKDYQLLIKLEDQDHPPITQKICHKKQNPNQQLVMKKDKP